MDSSYKDVIETVNDATSLKNQSSKAIVIVLLTGIEDQLYGAVRNANELFLSITYGKHQAGIILVRSLSDNSKFQICYTMGGKRWRERGRPAVPVLIATINRK